MRGLFAVVFFVFCSWGSGIATAEAKSMVAQRSGVNVYSEPSLKGKVLQTLTKGTEVVVTDSERKGLFLSVRLQDGVDGFVPYIQLVEKSDENVTKVMNYVRQLVKPKDQADNSARKRSAAAVMGIRGLAASKSEELDSVSNARPNLKAVYEMEERDVNGADLEMLRAQVGKEMDSRLGEISGAAETE